MGTAVHRGGRVKAGVLAEPSLVGRERELEELEAFLNSAVEGKGKTVFVSGEAGSGKTRFVTEFLNRAKKQGITTLTGWCLSNAAVPYFPFFEAFNAYFSGEHDASGKEKLDIGSLLVGPGQVEKAEKPPLVSAQVWKDQTFVAVAKMLSSISAKKPVILFIDDVQWADSASLALIHYIARATKSEKVLLLATFRSEALVPDSEGRPHLLVETLRLMGREDLVEEIKITNLNQAALSKLAENMLGGNVQQEFAEKLADRSQGNPLFVVETLRMLCERNILVREDSRWRLTDDCFGIPAKIKDIILQRLGALLHGQREVLDAASVIGEKFEPELLASVLGRDPLEILKMLDDVAKNTSLVCCDEEMCRFDHARSRDAVYDQISPALKRGYHTRVAEKLESTNKSGKQFLCEIAYHYAQAGNREKAIKYSLAAGQDALSRWSNAEAVKQFSYVLQMTGKRPECTEEDLVALEGLGDALKASNMFRESLKPYEELANKSELGIVRLRALRKAMESAFQLSDSSELMNLVKKAEPYVAADRLENARVLVARGRVSHLQSDFWAATRDMEAALQVFEEVFSLSDVAIALSGLSVYHASWGGRLKEGLSEALRVVTLFDEIEDFPQLLISRWVAGLAFTNDLLISEALRDLARVIEIDEKLKMGFYTALVYANCQLSRCYVIEDDFETALTFSLKALEFSKNTDGIVPRGMVYSDLSLLYARLGNLRQAEEYFDKLMKLPKEVFVHPLVKGTLAMAVFFASKKQWEESNRAFNQQFEWVKNNFYPSEKLNAKRHYAWALEKQGHVEEAKMLLEECRKIRQGAEEMFEHADLQARLMVRRNAVVGKEFEMRLDLVNVGRKPLSLARVENILPADFGVANLPFWCDVQSGNIEMKNREIGAFLIESVKLNLKASKPGTFNLTPQLVYIDDLGQTKTCKMNTMSVTVHQAPLKVRSGRISTGLAELDELLLGGIPEQYSMVLVAPSSNESELLVKRFLETAAQTDQTVIYVTTETQNAKTLAKTYPTNFSVFLCGRKAELFTENLPNIHKLSGIDNLTEIEIAIAKFFRTLDSDRSGSKIACVEIVSDVLLQHHAVVTRKWLSGLIANLKSQGFTTLVVIDPQMHVQEEVQAILGLFDGEIRIHEKETPEGTKQVLKIRKLTNQKYSEKEIILNKEAFAN